MRLSLVLILGLVLGTTTAARAQTYDYCARGGNPDRIAVLVDRSSAYNRTDVERLARGLNALRDELDSSNHIRATDPPETAARGAVIEIWPIVSYTAQAAPIFSGCLPNCPLDMSIFDSCRERAVKADREKFWSDLFKQVDGDILTASSTLNGESPIVETIAKAMRESQPTKVVVFSDFLEFHSAGNSLPQASLYSLNEGEWRRYSSALLKANVRPNFKGTRFVGYGFGEEIGGRSNLAKGQGINDAHWRSIFKWWVGFLQENGAAGFVLDREYPGITAPKDPAPLPPPDRRPS